MISTSKHAFTAGPWEYIPGTEHHGPYVAGPMGGDICDCYAMSNPMASSIRNGGTSFPINHQGEAAEANARLIAEAGTVAHETGLTPRQLAEQRAELLAALKIAQSCLASTTQDSMYDNAKAIIRAAIAKATGADQ